MGDTSTKRRDVASPPSARRDTSTCAAAGSDGSRCDRSSLGSCSWRRSLPASSRPSRPRRSSWRWASPGAGARPGWESPPRSVALAVVTAIFGYRAHVLAARGRAAAGDRRSAVDLRAAVAAQGHPAGVPPQVDARRGEDLPRSRRRRHDWPGERRSGFDMFSFMVSLKGTFLEGMEVVFIVITFGLNAHNVPVAVFGAVAAVIVVAILAVSLPQAAGDDPREHHEVRRRAAARVVRHLLGRRGPRRLPQRSARASRGRAPTPRSSSCSSCGS